MSEHKALSAFEQAKLQEEVEELKLRVARLADAVSNYFSALEVTTKLHTDQDDWNLDNAARALDEALSPKADQRWLLDKQAELLELTEAAIAAPRCFFMGLEQGRKNLESMREHLDRCRDDYSCWPTWAKEGTGRITESGKAILVFAMMAYELRKQGEIK